MHYFLHKCRDLVGRGGFEPKYILKPLYFSRNFVARPTKAPQHFSVLFYYLKNTYTNIHNHLYIYTYVNDSHQKCYYDIIFTPQKAFAYIRTQRRKRWFGTTDPLS